MNKLKSLKLFLLLLIVKSTVTISTTVAVAETKNSNEKMIPQRLVERLLNRSAGENSRILQGKLPEDLRIQIPQTPQTQILGSIERGKYSYQIELNTPQSLQEIESFYQNKLINSGWKKVHIPAPPQPAFLESEKQTNVMLGFCNLKERALLNMKLNELENNSTEVTLLVHTPNPMTFSCPQFNTDLSSSTPKLKPPKNTKVTPNQIGIPGTRVSNSTAKIESELNIAQLNQHYINQMEQAGWKKIADTKSNQTMLSMWTFKGEKNSNWQGIITLKPIGGKSGEYFVNLILTEEQE